jgi:hypothetical protein
VKVSGMCWTITIPGDTRGSRVSTSCRARVPPVEVPMATTRSVVRVMAEAEAAVGGARITSAVNF